GGPRKQDQEAQEPAAAEVPDERVGEQAGDDDHDRLRDHGEQERVPESAAEDRIVQLLREVREADPLAGQRPRRRVGEAEIDGENERHTHQRADEQDRRRDQQRSKNTPPFRRIAEGASTPSTDGNRAAHCEHHNRISAAANVAPRYAEAPPWRRSSSNAFPRSTRTGRARSTSSTSRFTTAS